MHTLYRPVVSTIILCLALVFKVDADVLKIKQDAPDEHVVVKGDTLWDISSLFLHSPWLWPKLWKMNPYIDNPHLIYPGDVLRLIYTPEGEPMLVMGKRVIKLSPQKRISHTKDEPIPILPLNQISHYLSYEQTLEPEEMDKLPYVLGSDKVYKRALPGDLLYIKGDLSGHDKFAIYRKGKTYFDPENQDELGHEAVLVAVAQLISLGDLEEGIPAKVKVESAKQEVKASDVLIPIRQGQDLPALFKMRPLENELEGNIIATPTDVAGVTKYEVVVLNKGFINDVAPGHILSISRKSPTVVDQGLGPKYQEDATRYEKFVGSMKEVFKSKSNKGVYDMPYEKIGQVMLFKVYERVSYGIITQNKTAIRVGDRIHTVTLQ